ncbi:protein of unknown function [Pustulibacterium marinum]|uniref:DUF4251 domain-containing protein n=2 Tax=Pustulibacterium marinum TaxID=1224947 RepID=A0A1I7F0S4_9FLAO|nr:protein of unknown function [Pustulibacterium marinum]
MLSLFIIGCGSSKTITTISEEDLSLLESKQFMINNEWLLPMGAGQINLIGNPNHIQIKNDSLDVYLPYFGVRQFGGSYNGEAGIKFSGVMTDYHVNEGKKGAKMIQFSSKDGTENFKFSITIYPEGKTLTQIISTSRDNVSYRGYLEKLPEDL